MIFLNENSTSIVGQSLFQMTLLLVFIIIRVTAYTLLFVEGLIEFVFNGKHLNVYVITISLLGIENCNPVILTSNITSTRIQLLQLVEYDHTQVIRWKIEISHSMYYRCMHSNVSVVHNGEHDYLLDVNRKQCAQMHESDTTLRIWRTNDKWPEDK